MWAQHGDIMAAPNQVGFLDQLFADLSQTTGAADLALPNLDFTDAIAQIKKGEASPNKLLPGSFNGKVTFGTFLTAVAGDNKNLKVPAVIQAAADAGHNLNIQNPQGVAPMHRAAQSGSELTITALRKNEAAVDIADAAGNTPLMLAVQGATRANMNDAKARIHALMAVNKEDPFDKPADLRMKNRDGKIAGDMIPPDVATALSAFLKTEYAQQQRDITELKKKTAIKPTTTRKAEANGILPVGVEVALTNASRDVDRLAALTGNPNQLALKLPADLKTELAKKGSDRSYT
jgi:hypothetical protein